MRSLLVALWGLLLTAQLALPAAASTSLHDLAYGPDPLQRMDVYLPEQPKDAPVIVMVHGGGWRYGDKSNDNVWRNKADHWTRQGAIVVSVNYRLLPKAGPLEQAHDVARALSFVQEQSVHWGGSAARLILMGHSAGGHLVALLSANPTLAHMQGAKPWLGSVVLDTAALDIPKLMSATQSRLYQDAFGTDPAYWEATSPMLQMAAGIPPILMVCSTQRVLPCPEARRFEEAAVARGGKVQTLPVDYSHRSINAVLGMDMAFTSQVDEFLQAIGLYSTQAQR